MNKKPSSCFSHRYLLLIVGFIAIAAQKETKAQNHALDTINSQLRQLFSNLDKPANPKWFLYDMAAHVTDSTFYTTNCPDTNNTDIWFRAYEEMYHSAYDTTTLTHPNSVFESAQQFTDDTIPIGIMNYAYYFFKDDALTTNTYFNFDTVNTILTDKYPRPDWPYNEGSIFIGSPLVHYSNFANPVFRIDPQYIYYDEFTDPANNNLVLKIDFGDGNGWIAFDHTIVTHHQVTYDTSSTERVLRIAWFIGEEAMVNTQSRLSIRWATPATPPDLSLQFAGMDVGVYRNCSEGEYQVSGKTIIYLEGFDVMNNRNARQIYNEMILDRRNISPDAKLAQLRNYGYDILVVDWDNAGIDMRFNALYLVNLLQWLKDQIIERGDEEQFVLIGESMGGVIARYALTYMESDEFQSHSTASFFIEAAAPNNAAYLATHEDILDLPDNWDNLDKMHNTRLLITLDAPHQGANVPISLQKAYQYSLNILGSYFNPLLRRITTNFNLFLDGHAAQQLLIYHLETEHADTYTQHPYAAPFFTQLEMMGDYPQFAKVVLMSSGDLSGANQTNPFTQSPRTPNDRLCDFSCQLYAKVLWFRVPLFGADLEMRSNPLGNAQVFQANMGSYGIRIKLRWFGIRIQVGYNSILNAADWATTEPYCTSAGGHLGTIYPPGFVQPVVVNEWATPIIPALGYRHTIDGNGCLLFESHQNWGPSGFLSTNFDYSFCSDGGGIENFCFIPLQSALDYGPIEVGEGGAYDVEDDDINTKLSIIPDRVDMIIGWPGTGNPNLGNNHHHLVIRNDIIDNLDASSTIYNSCAFTGNPNLQRGFLNLEIGDEELYLENNALHWQAAYQAEYDIHVNDRNPRYEYPSQPFIPATNMLAGIYSRDDDFIIANDGFATFIYDPTAPANVGFNFTNPNGSFAEVQQPLDVCCIDYMQMRNAGIRNDAPAIRPFVPGFLTIYPNPNDGHKALLRYKFNKPGKVYAELYNISGQKMLTQPLPVPDATKEVTTVLDLTKLKPASGLYIIRLYNGSETLNGKLIIK